MPREYFAGLAGKQSARKWSGGNSDSRWTIARWLRRDWSSRNADYPSTFARPERWLKWPETTQLEITARATSTVNRDALARRWRRKGTGPRRLRRQRTPEAKLRIDEG